MQYYTFHIGDYSKAQKNLSLMEDLAFRRLIDLYYDRESVISLEIERVCRQIGMRDYREEVSYVLSEFFVKTDQGYSNKRCEKEIKKYRAKAERAKNANNKRWSNNDDSLKSDKKSETILDKKSETILDKKSETILDKKSDINSDQISETHLESISDTLSSPNQEPITNNQEKDKKNYVEQARLVISYLNNRAGRNFRVVDSATNLISARIKEGYCGEDFKRVIDAKCDDWLGDPKWEKYLRPETLFNATKFNGYYGQLGSANGFSELSTTELIQMALERGISDAESMNTPTLISKLQETRQ